MKHLLLNCVIASLLMTASNAAIASEAMEQRLRQRIAAAPDNASNWRMLAKLAKRRGDLPAASNALQRAVVLDASSPAIQYDLGVVLLELGQVEAAIFHLNRVVELSPDSEHGAEAIARLNQLGTDPRYATLVSFQAPWASASPIAEVVPTELASSSKQQRRWMIEFEIGGLYNSNVELAPISRQLSASELGGFQTYVAPDIEYLLIDMDVWQVGTMLDTYFSFNESHLSTFNLQHYQPGAYIDRLFLRGEEEWAARVQYGYSLDMFDGQTFGNRHSVTTSLARFHSDPVISLLYWTVDYTDFRDDGTTPTIDSVDGFTNTVGASRSWDLDFLLLRQFDVGADGQWADLRGSDHAYRGGYLYAEARLAGLLGTELITTGGWGYRHYPDFAAAPDRDESFYVGSIQLDREFLKCWRSTVFFNYDSFDSENTSFAAERYTTGAYVTFQR